MILYVVNIVIPSKGSASRDLRTRTGNAVPCAHGAGDVLEYGTAKILRLRRMMRLRSG